jgi:hypothetical protein
MCKASNDLTPKAASSFALFRIALVTKLWGEQERVNRERAVV